MQESIKQIIILGSVVACIMVGSFFVMLGNHSSTDNMNDVTKDEVSESQKDEDASLPLDEEPLDGTDIEDSFEVESITGLMMGLDASGSLTDVLMVVYLDIETKEIKLISVPRDLEIDYRAEPFKTMRLNFNEKVNDGDIEADIHQRSYSKVNEIYLDTGKTKAGLYYTKAVVEEIIGIKIDYLAVIDVYGFKDIIDVIGGIDFYVPQNMHYTDSRQDLYIDLKEGFQHLDGEHAMQLVRFRKYTLGDIQRIQVQQDFLTAVYGKLKSLDDFTKFGSIIEKTYSIAETDFGLKTALDYAEYIFDLEIENLLNGENMITIPSWGELEEYESGDVIKTRWHQYWDAEEARQVVEDLVN